VRGVFVTGTDTGVGKTVVAAAIARTAANRGKTVRVFKPAVSGLADLNGVAPDHVLLRAAAGSRQADDEIAPYRYERPLSPHLAAQLASEAIDPQRLRMLARLAGEGADLLVCEGVGGFMVPLNRSYLVRDLARDLGHPVLIAASPSLGTINHTLLTIDAVREPRLTLAGVVLTPWPDEPGDLELSNRETIAELGDVHVEVLPRLDLEQPASWPALELAGLAN
jgi:dethiobiotin synthetase